MVGLHRRRPLRPYTFTTGPNPFWFVGLSFAAFASFYFLANYRAQTYPASQQPRQQDNPLVSSRRKDPEG